MSKSSIEWTEETWNPIVGCSIISPGCTNCYAMKTAARNEAMGISRYDGTTRKVNGNTVWTGKLAQAPVATLLAPLRRKKPTTYFVNSMGDLFHEDGPDEWIDRVFAVMALCPQHTFQVLTKRAARMREYMTKPHSPGQFITVLDDGRRIDTSSVQVRTHSAMCELFGLAPARALNEACAWQDRKHPGGDGFIREWPLPNVWLGVSAERQPEGDERIPLLLNTPAAVRFISVEPSLGPIDLTRLCIHPQKPGSIRAGIHIDALRGRYCESGVAYKGDWDVNGPAPPDSERRRLDWVIVGGESGPNARPMHPDWALSLRNQCAAAGVAFFFKQWGEWAPGECADYLPTRTERTASWFVDEWSFGALTPTASAETHYEDAPDLYRIGKKRAGRLLDGIEHNSMPVRP